ncbi:hypothetical protein LX32DRAFT_642305 [Colletotrichum zoysiae]|uniref:Uncharacterized protein n=1 Tax=Colletotrichum zoysiae TaxID=1216348 RepID=A0AAD9LYS9_9PEZI|nr:hypothetical protein LX32DRAFT_642305 [Colletotrichum zoysiae]
MSLFITSSRPADASAKTALRCTYCKGGRKQPSRSNKKGPTGRKEATSAFSVPSSSFSIAGITYGYMTSIGASVRQQRAAGWTGQGQGQGSKRKQSLDRNTTSPHQSRHHHMHGSPSSSSSSWSYHQDTYLPTVFTLQTEHHRTYFATPIRASIPSPVCLLLLIPTTYVLSVLLSTLRIMQVHSLLGWVRTHRVERYVSTLLSA